MHKKDQALFRRLTGQLKEVPKFCPKVEKIKRLLFFIGVFLALFNPLTFPIWKFFWYVTTVIFDFFIGEILAKFIDLFALVVIVGYFGYISHHEVGRLQKSDWQREEWQRKDWRIRLQENL